jgi:hypothetical protein
MVASRGVLSAACSPPIAGRQQQCSYRRIPVTHATACLLLTHLPTKPAAMQAQSNSNRLWWR